MPKLPKWLSEVSWRTVIGAVLLGGIVHITATMAVPLVSSGHALARLRDALPANRMVLLPPPAPGKQPLPFLAPDAVYAMCRYDISVDSLIVTAAMAQAGWTLSLHTPQGDNFYRHAGPGGAPRRRFADGGAERRASGRVRGHAAPRERPRRRWSPRRRGRASSSCARRSGALPGAPRPKPALRRATCTPVKRQ